MGKFLNYIKARLFRPSKGEDPSCGITEGDGLLLSALSNRPRDPWPSEDEIRGRRISHGLDSHDARKSLLEDFDEAAARWVARRPGCAEPDINAEMATLSLLGGHGMVPTITKPENNIQVVPQRLLAEKIDVPE